MSSCQQNETERLRAEVEQLKTKLMQTQRLSALGELVSTTTHEFNNVLMTIINYAKMGMRHEDKATRDKAFAKIHQAGNRAAKITNSVLGMARNRSEKFEKTNLTALIEQTMVLLEREMLKYRIDVEIEIEQGLPEISAIGNQIQQVLVNLLINARQAMSEGGRLVIRMQQEPENDRVQICVRDFGVGIPEQTLRRIFDPYYTTKAGPDDTGKGGTGIGLSTCKNIIEAHGGKIRVESSVGKGTCFTLFCLSNKSQRFRFKPRSGIDRIAQPTLPSERLSRSPCQRRVWQVWQKKVERCAWTIRLIVFELQFGQNSPALS